MTGAAIAMAMIAAAMQPQKAEKGARRKNMPRPRSTERRRDAIVGNAGRVGEITVIGSGSSDRSGRS